MEKELPKNRKSNNSIGFIIVFICLMLFLPSFWNKLFTDSVNTSIIVNGVIEEIINVEGVFVRDEKLLNAPFEGLCIATAEYGDRLGVNDTVATIIEEEKIPLLEELEKTEIEIVSRVIENNPHIVAEVMTSYKGYINNEIDKIINMHNKKDISGLSKTVEQLNIVLKKQAMEVCSTKQGQVYLAEKKDILDELTNNVNSSKKIIETESSGVIWYTTDGYELRLTPKDLDNIDSSIITKCKNIEEHQTSIEGRFKVETGESFAKIVKGISSWYVFKIPLKYEDEITNSKIILLQFEGMDERVNAEIVSIKKDDNNNLITVASFENKMIETISKRYSKCELILDSYSGLKVPIKSLDNFNGADNTADIMLIKYNLAAKRKVKIMGKNESSAIIKNYIDNDEEKMVNLYDIFIINPLNIYEGQLIEE